MTVRPTARAWVRRFHSALVHPLIEFVLPAACFRCGSELTLHQSAGACVSCWTGFDRPGSPPCPICGLPGPDGTDLFGPWRRGCGTCSAVGPTGWSRVLTTVTYDDHARSFLLRAKIGGRAEVLSGLGRQLAAAVGASGLAVDCTAIVPVPSHPVSSLRRGFQPARILAQAVARRSGIPLRRRALRARLLGQRNTKRLSARRRHEVRSMAFAARHQVAGARILLVDDVMTTGATAAACSEAMLERGALEVRLAVWARTPRRVDRPEVRG